MTSPKQHSVSCYQSGFTLVEVLVSVGIFTIVFTIAIGGFVSAMRTQRQLQALIAANSNASLVIEQMAREIRTGVAFHVSDVSGICTDCRLSFLNVKGEYVDYWLDASSSLARSSAISGSVFPTGYPITAENVAVKYLQFLVLGDSCPNPLRHNPRVTIALGISPRSEQGVRNDVTEVQTTISSRQGLICEDVILNVL